jgi:phosphatidylglycerophosphate synthase
MRLLADALGVMRLGLAVAFACTFPGGGWTPLVVFGLATASDYVDGPLARRAGGPSTYGVLLDSGADIAFVLLALSSGVAMGRLPWIVPAVIACSAAPYLVATLQRSRAVGTPVRAYTTVGHWAGVCNYALVGLLAGSVALPSAAWRVILTTGSAAVVALNLTAVALRVRATERLTLPRA